MKFEIGEDELEASELYPDYNYTSIDEVLDIFLVDPIPPASVLLDELLFICYVIGTLQMLDIVSYCYFRFVFGIVCAGLCLDMVIVMVCVCWFVSI